MNSSVTSTADSLPRDPEGIMFDLEATRSYLLSFDIFSHAPQEGINYLAEAVPRYLITLEMLLDRDQSAGSGCTCSS